MAEIKATQAAPEEKAISVLAETTMVRGIYSNLVVVKHTPEEFILDFLMHYPDGASLVSRILLSPGHARRLRAALDVSIEAYENSMRRPPDRRNAPPFRPARVKAPKDEKAPLEIRSAKVSKKRSKAPR